MKKIMKAIQIVICIVTIAVAGYNITTDIPLMSVQQLLLSVMLMLLAFNHMQRAEEHGNRKYDSVFYFFIISGLFNAVVAVAIW